jgi:glutamate carboxypeptidase
MPLSALESRLTAAIARRASALLEDLRLHVALPTGWNNAPALNESRQRFADRCAALGAVQTLIPPGSRPAWLHDGSASAPQHAAPPTAINRRIRAASSASSSSPGKAILIAGHLDTVHDPAGPFNALSIAPDGKTAVGPGCVDMKGGLVIAMHALEALDEVGIAADWSFLLNSDEETGSYYSDRALRDEAASGRYACCLALEPAMAKGELAIERGGSGQFMYQAAGRAAHVGRDPQSGISAVDALARVILAAHAANDYPAGRVINIGPLQCTSPANVVADHAAAWGNVRFKDPAGQQAVTEALTRAAQSAAPAIRDGLPRITLSTSFNRPAKPQTPATRTLAHAARSVAEDLGQALPFASSGGVCDGNITQDAGLPTIDTLGVRGGGLHTPQEWIDLSSLVERCQLLALLIARLAG